MKNKANQKHKSKDKMDRTIIAPNTKSSVRNSQTSQNNPTSDLQCPKQRLCSLEEGERRLHDTSSNSNTPTSFNEIENESRVYYKSHDQETTSQLLVNKTILTKSHHYSTTTTKTTFLIHLIRRGLNLIIFSLLFSHIYQLSILEFNPFYFSLTRGPLILPKIISAHALECNIDGDCASRDKICHENKCICARDRPIEDQGRCLPLALINGECTLPEQCLGNSQCVDGTCSCGNDAISLYNPSTKIFYCHPKRQLNEECNYDSQCPSNSYCSTSKNGCLCQNGYAPSNILNQFNGIETIECLPKKCSQTSYCEEYHECADNICRCLVTHFDPTVAKCYKFGSTGGKRSEDLLDNGNATTTTSNHGHDNFYSIFKDLTESSDKLWLVLTILIILSTLILLLIVILIRKYSLGYCWTAHKKEYEPNNKNHPKNGYFNKNSINNKSFRQKNGELDGEENGDDFAEDRSNLVRSNDKTGAAATKRNITAATIGEKNDYIKINIHDKETNKSSYQHELGIPLKTSTSTPV